jgi:hypothetical protein
MLRLVGDGPAHILGAENHAQRVIARRAPVSPKAVPLSSYISGRPRSLRHHGDQPREALGRCRRLLEPARDGRQECRHRLLGLPGIKAELARKPLDRFAVLRIGENVIKGGHRMLLNSRPRDLMHAAGRGNKQGCGGRIAPRPAAR